MAQRKTARSLAEPTCRHDGRSAALPAGYGALLAALKPRVRSAQLRAAVEVNRELSLLHWYIGRIIAETQKTKGYGKQAVERLAEDLQNEFPGRLGLWLQNARYMRNFYLAWTEELQTLQQTVGESAANILSQPVRGSAALGPPASISVKWQKTHKWDDRFVDRLSGDSAKAFQQPAGFSRDNLYRIRVLFPIYSPADAIVAQRMPQLPAAILKPLLGELKLERRAAPLQQVRSKKHPAEELYAPPKATFHVTQ